mmetsp:Transcript_17043/g.39894  ORF Transcript_17043/g.39894 Transcript_17043/m.39894 type:complete len:369 (+) Transcript_17043:74-1180(+)
MDALLVAALPLLDAASDTLGAPSHWPRYATRTFGALAAVTGLLSIAQMAAASGKPTKVKDSGANTNVGEFRLFQSSYLVVYLTIMLADWLQGTNMYTLYAGYDMPIGTLFLTGFTSSAVFGTFLGLYVDKYGRKAGCIVFCVLEIIINSLEHFPNLWLLLLGRILGGISTSLLFSAFESWMVTEHRKRKFPDEWLASTYSYSSIGNGLVAILAGVLAQVAADAYGDIGPFRLAIALTVLTLVFVCFWKENYGEQETGDAGGAFGMAWREICNKREIALLGGVNAFFEGAMYTFVFMWVPTIFRVAPESPPPPIGLIFSCFMICITLGGMVFTPLLKMFGVEGATVLISAIAIGTMLVPVLTSSFAWVL